METVANVAHREPWNKGKIVGQSVVDGQRGALLRGVDAGLQLRQPLGIALRRWREIRRLVAHAAAIRLASPDKGAQALARRAQQLKLQTREVGSHLAGACPAVQLDPSCVSVKLLSVWILAHQSAKPSTFRRSGMSGVRDK